MGLNGKTTVLFAPGRMLYVYNVQFELFLIVRAHSNYSRQYKEGKKGKGKGKTVAT